ncbi:hypothetical protein [Psychrobacter sp. HII-4]|uniref:hypothetical protein n=1 Tax=Psychrobacter sp. HII-4 TaxID=1569264 RepID=UPI0019198D5B|nr:hypothetical protein [Psychrobacter sp. HII-4]
MSNLKLRISKLSLVVVLALSNGLVISACSTDATNETSQHLAQPINKSDSKDFESIYAEANQGDPQAQFQLGCVDNYRKWIIVAAK